MTSFFFYQGWSDLDKILQTGYDMSTAVMCGNGNHNVEFQYGGRLGEFNGMSSHSHVSYCKVLPLGEFTVTIPENSIRHIENRFSPYFISLFLMQFRL